MRFELFPTFRRTSIGLIQITRHHDIFFLSNFSRTFWFNFVLSNSQCLPPSKFTFYFRLILWWSYCWAISNHTFEMTQTKFFFVWLSLLNLAFLGEWLWLQKLSVYRFLLATNQTRHFCQLISFLFDSLLLLFKHLSEILSDTKTHLFHFSVDIG